MISVLIAGGGTGGHVFPGLALAAALSRMRPDARVAFVGTSRGMETRIVPEAGFELEIIDVLPFAKTIGLKRYLAPATAIRAAVNGRAVLRRRHAGVVASMGGYASLPISLAARSLGIPIVLHEQNAIPGRANLVTARLTPNVAVSFPDSAKLFPKPVRVLGNPLRESLAHLDRFALRAEGRNHFGLQPDRATLLVSGGSQGARRLNEAAVQIAASWASRGDRQILLIAGRGNAIDLPGASRAIEFTDRMDLAYSAADIVIARSGAGVFELACAGLPSILVPYPFARDDHQRANARWFEAAGAARVVSDADAIGSQLESMVESIVSDSDLCARMSQAAHGLARPNAADDLAAWVLECAKENA